MISQLYNLNKLGQSGEEIAFKTTVEDRAKLARDAGALSVPEFSAKIVLKKTSANRFSLAYALSAQVVQACVVSLEPVHSKIEKSFTRELHYTPNLRRAAGEKEIILAPEDEEAPEEIESPHYDLAAPLAEEFLLALDPYPRAPGAAFTPPEGLGDAPESPFAVLKSLKSGD